MARRRSRRHFPIYKVAILCIAITLVVLLVQRGWLFLHTDKGRAWTLSMLHQEQGPQGQALLTHALHDALKVIGATQAELRPGVDSDACTRWNMEIPPNVSLMQANYALTSAVREVGGRVVDGSETKGATEDTLELRFGLTHEATHRIVLLEPHRSGRPEPRARLAVLIEDTDMKADALLSSFVRLGEPFTFGILPLEGARRHSETIAASHGEVLLYLPMEGRSGRSVPDAVQVDMRPPQIRRSVGGMLREIGHVAGIVNYQGQLATQDPEVMKAVLEEAKANGLFFVDARTSEQSIASTAAVQVGGRCVEGTMRLDAGGNDIEALRARLTQAGDAALEGHTVVAMARMTPELLEVLRAELPKLRERGVQVVRTSDLARMGS